MRGFPLIAVCITVLSVCTLVAALIVGYATTRAVMP